LVVGLGNPGPQYAATRHNAGFMAVDYIGDRLGIRFDADLCKSLVAAGEYEGRELTLAKPQTFMNLSGRAVSALIDRLSLSPDDLTVIHDDIDIPLGKVKEKRGGGSAGHNGIGSIIEEIGTGDFRRLRIGVGRPSKGGDASEFVLSPFEENERDAINESIEKCFSMAVNFREE